MSNSVEQVLSDLRQIFDATEVALNEWQGDNLKFPVLVGILTVKLSWDEKQVAAYDPLVRYFVRSNPDYHVSRGANGGIVRASDVDKKVLNKKVKGKADPAIKAQMRAAIEAKLTPLNITTNDGEITFSDFEG